MEATKCLKPSDSGHEFGDRPTGGRRGRQPQGPRDGGTRSGSSGGGGRGPGEQSGGCGGGGPPAPRSRPYPAQIPRQAGIAFEASLWGWSGRRRKAGPACPPPPWRRPPARRCGGNSRQRESDQLRRERILKRGHLLGTPEMRFRLIEDQRDAWPVRVMCDALSVSPSGYSSWRSEAHAGDRSHLELGFQQIQLTHRERYGAPRIHAALRAEGQTVSRKRIERVMRHHGIRARAPRRYRVCTTDSKHAAKAPNGRNCAAER